MKNISNDLECPAPSQEEIKEVLSHLDTDNNGKVDFKEFKVLIVDVLKAMKGV